MKRFFTYCAAGILVTSAAYSQSAERPTFEVADIHPSPRVNQFQFTGPLYGGGRYELQYATMVDLIHAAYGVETDRITGGPNWVELDRFHVFAKAPAGSTAETRKLMLQNLLADRFHLVVRHDSKPVPVMALTLAKRGGMKASDGSGEAGCNFTVQNNPGGPPTDGQPIQLPIINYTCHNTTMEAFAAAIPNIPTANQYLDGKKIVDRTELQGAWDFTVRITPKVPPGINTIGEKMPLPEAFDKQLGLKLEASTSPMPVLFVEGATRPTPNPPETAKVFPPAPTEFEVAELKPSPPDTSGGRGGQQSPPVLKNGRLIVQNLTLQNLIAVAWDLSGPDMLVGAPKWLNSDRFDLIAKAPTGVEIGDFNAQQINLDVLRPMIQSLLKERFKMVVHTEDRPMDAYTLMAGKPKLTPADPNGHTKWQEGIAAAKDSKNANTSLGRLVTCQNMTMAQFAELLPQIANGYVHSAVVDATGLEGAYDFTFSFSPIGALQAISGGRGGEGGGSDAASDPSGAISLPDALSRQLGLKLELQKRPVKVLVIDHVDQKPTDN